MFGTLMRIREDISPTTYTILMSGKGYKQSGMIRLTRNEAGTDRYVWSTEKASDYVEGRATWEEAWEKLQTILGGNADWSSARRDYVYSYMNAFLGQHSPAEASAYAILAGVQILHQFEHDATLVALDKNVLCEGPDPDDTLDTVGIFAKLEKLGWDWDPRQGAWSYYTGH